MNWFSATGHVDDGLRGGLRIEARDEGAAKDLHDMVQGSIAPARLQASRQPAMSALVHSLQLGGQDTTVSLEFSIPASVIADLASALPRPPHSR